MDSDEAFFASLNQVVTIEKNEVVNDNVTIWPKEVKELHRKRNEIKRSIDRLERQRVFLEKKREQFERYKSLHADITGLSPNVECDPLVVTEQDFAVFDECHELCKGLQLAAGHSAALINLDQLARAIAFQEEAVGLPNASLRETYFNHYKSAVEACRKSIFDHAMNLMSQAKESSKTNAELLVRGQLGPFFKIMDAERLAELQEEYIRYRSDALITSAPISANDALLIIELEATSLLCLCLSPQSSPIARSFLEWLCRSLVERVSETSCEAPLSVDPLIGRIQRAFIDQIKL